MLDIKTAGILITPWLNLPYAPTDGVLLRHIVKQLAESSRSETHCRQIVDALKMGERFPIYEEIKRVAWSLLSEAERKLVGCPQCSDTGFVKRSKVIRGMVVDGYDPCQRCHPAANGNGGRKAPRGAIERQ
jgi:predicted Zn-ribbon and HTH transcriptional regulator